ncbi:uncharacterized protein LOC135842883 isoform X1 [Planococcus citri]|uniref:uncharacterized protein LOC135842883 isoform X1 n=1 Tax=Planococcus citri TaxID=170843 RepID=UPI0031F8B709
MNSGMRSCFRLCSDSILSKLKQNIQPEMAKQRLYSTFWRTISSKQMVASNFKSTLDHRFSSSATQFATKNISSPVETKLLEHVEKKMPKEKENADSVCGFEKKVDKSDLIFSKSLPNEKILARFNTNHYVKVEDYKEPIGNETGADSESFEYKINPNFRVEITRGSTTLGFDCIIQDDHSDDGCISSGKYDTSSDDDGCNQKKMAKISKDNEKLQPNVLQCPDTSMFIIRNYAFNEGQLNENNYQCCGVGNVRDAAMYNIMKNLLREKGICDEFLSEVIFHGKNHETDNHGFFIKNLKKFMKGETVCGPSGRVAVFLANSRAVQLLVSAGLLVFCACAFVLVFSAGVLAFIAYASGLAYVCYKYLGI